MNQYRNLHLWLLIPFAIAIVGFMPSYWLRLPEVPWRQHLHGITATGWFVLLLIQPYLITRGHKNQHRLYGMFALFLAGGVVVSGLGAIPYNLTNENLPAMARYGFSFIDIVLMPGFAIAVLMAVKTASRVDDHARWMISTVFWAISPGFFRFLFLPMALLNIDDIGSKVPMMIAFTGVINIVVLSFLMYRDRRLHPAYLSAAIGSVVMFTPASVGEMAWWRNIADALFTI